MSRTRLLVVASVVLSTACGGPQRGADYARAFGEARRAQHDGHWEQAAVAYDRAAATAKIKRDADYARYEAALARVRAGDVARGASELRALGEAKPANEYSDQAAYKAAELAIASEPDRGYEEMTSVAVRFPDTGMGRVALTRVLRHADEKGPAETLARIAALEPRLGDGSLGQALAYERAKRLRDLERHGEARDAFLAVARRWPYPFGVYFDDALYFASEEEEKLGRLPEAVEHLNFLLSHRESSHMIGSYERPKYVPALLRLATLYATKLGDREAAKNAYHRLYRDFPTSTQRDDALWKEAELWQLDGDKATACDRLATLTREFADSRFVPCAVERCPNVARPAKSKAPASCRAYLQAKPATEP